MRRQHDRYFTPEFAAKALVERVALTGRVLECCAGDGAIYKELPDSCTKYANDIAGGYIGSVEIPFAVDVTKEEAWRSLSQGLVGLDWVVTNPPFNQAAQIVPLAFKYARIGIAMLLRKSYTEPCRDRQQWLLDHKLYLSNQIFLPRISFTGDGKTDSVACDWLVWRRDGGTGCEVDWVLK